MQVVCKILIVALGAASFVSAKPCTTARPNTACNADYCLRALRASQFPTRLPQASEDCKRIIDSTIVPDLVTVTQYSTVSETDTVTIPTTLIETFYDTYTDVIHATATTDELVTVTAPAKRDVVPPVFPDYASPCSGIVRFSSACSCIGVTAKTVTAPTPSTTITLPTTATSLTSITEVVETTSVTITDATVSVTTTDTTVTNQIATTVQPPSTEVTGVARLILNGEPQSAWVSNYESSGITYAFVTTTVGPALQLRLDEAGHLWYGTKIAKGDINDGNLQLFFIDPTQAPVRQPYTCSTDANNYLKCYVINADADLVFSWRSNNFIYVGKRANIVASGYPIVELKLIN